LGFTLVTIADAFVARDRPRFLLRRVIDFRTTPILVTVAAIEVCVFCLVWEGMMESVRKASIVCMNGEIDEPLDVNPTIPSSLRYCTTENAAASARVSVILRCW